jgi:hypothetical protein
MESTLNNTVVPLLSGRIYIGTWEKSLYNSAVITVLADTTTELICYQSLNKVQTQTTTFQTQAGRYFTYNINLNLPYVYFTVRNNSATNQTLLNFSVIYKNIPDNNKGTLQIWNDSASTGVNGVSSPIFLNQNSANMTFFGNVDGGTTLTFQISNDNINYYDSQYSLTASSAQDFGFSIPASSIFYARLKSSSDVTITAYANYS